MKKGQTLLWVIGGAAVVYFLYKKYWTPKKEKEVAVETEIVADVVKKEADNYSPGLKKKYDIVMPSDQVSKKVQKKAKELTKGRYSVKKGAVMASDLKLTATKEL
jgi:hypothetical protein